VRDRACGANAGIQHLPAHLLSNLFAQLYALGGPLALGRVATVCRSFSEFGGVGRAWHTLDLTSCFVGPASDRDMQLLQYVARKMPKQVISLHLRTAPGLEVALPSRPQPFSSSLFPPCVRPTHITVSFLSSPALSAAYFGVRLSALQVPAVPRPLWLRRCPSGSASVGEGIAAGSLTTTFSGRALSKRLQHWPPTGGVPPNLPGTQPTYTAGAAKADGQRL